MIDYTSIVTNNGNALSDLSKDNKVLLVFLRQLNCVFCREGLKDLAKKKDYFTKHNANLVFVHMTDYEIADMYFEKFKLSGYDHISDPGCNLYQDFGLVKGSFNQLFGLQNIIKGFEATMNGTFIALKQIGDGFQMPGVFLIENSQIKSSFIHKFASDKPDYEGIVNSCITID